jgi:hypothetical protein
VIKCTCKNGREITVTEERMAEAEGLTSEEVHDFMDTWLEHAEAVLDEQRVSRVE